MVSYSSLPLLPDDLKQELSIVAILQVVVDQFGAFARARAANIELNLAVDVVDLV